MFAAGAGWPPERRTRVKDIIVRHMWREVDPALDIEGHLLCEGTGLDIAGRNHDTWPADFREEVVERFPRLDLVDRVPHGVPGPGPPKARCAAATAIAAGLAGRIIANSLDG